jgi:hypothetical protein
MRNNPPKVRRMVAASEHGEEISIASTFETVQ